MGESNRYRSHTCNQLRLTDESQRVTLVGFVEGSKMEGVAIDVRDRTGSTSARMPPKPSRVLQDTWENLVPESVVQVIGRVHRREKRDHAMDTGEVLVIIEDLQILSAAEPVPGELDLSVLPGEDRLRYRPLWLRRSQGQQMLATRSKLINGIKSALITKGFIEVDTPVLGRLSADAKGSFVVPVGKGKAFSLPPSGWAYRQALVAGGVEKFFQVARCFRRESGEGRQPEFSALELEMAWSDEDETLAVLDDVLRGAISAAVGADVPAPPRLSYEEAIAKYGTPSPDLRMELPIRDAGVTVQALGSSEGLAAIGKGSGGARSIIVPGGVERLGDGELDQLTLALMRTRGAGLAATWLKHGRQTGRRGPGSFFFATGRAQDAMSALGANEGDALLLVGAPSEQAAHEAAGELRKLLIERIGDHSGNKFALAWIREAPLFTRDAGTGKVVGLRPPFTAPREADVAALEKDPVTAKARSFDLVINGQGVGIGSVRIHDRALQSKMFAAHGLRPFEAELAYPQAAESLRFAIPPHAGFTISLDRLVSLVTGQALEDSIPFPKNSSGIDLLFDAPGPLDPGVLRSLS